MGEIEDTTQKTILIVDDEQTIVDILVYNLRKEGYKTLEANDGITAVEMAFNNKPDLMLLDIMLPKMDGLNVCKKVRTKLNIPILMLTARDEEIDKILGLELGADDYITKPFSVRELVARVKANLRKLEIQQESEDEDNIVKVPQEKVQTDKEIVLGNLVLDLEKLEARVKGEKVDLTVREFEFLRFLSSQQGQAASREKLLKNVWGYDYFGDIRTVDVLVRRLRRKIEDNPEEPKILVTKRSVGYYIKTADSEE